MTPDPDSPRRSGNETFLVLGGGGMIGLQVIRQIARHLNPKRVIVASLLQREVRHALDLLKREFPKIHFLGFWGDVFLRSEWNNVDRQARLDRSGLLDDSQSRRELFLDLFGDIEMAYEGSQLVSLIHDHRPDVIIDSINTATAISYQDVYSASEVARTEFDHLAAELESEAQNDGGSDHVRTLSSFRLPRVRRALETLLISQSVPQLIRHVLLLHRAMREVGTRIYLKIGTTGTGGMGLNIPYTHSEDKPSAKLLTKNALAFAHTGLLFLMARTPGSPVVKEIKPAGMVGYADVTCRTIQKSGKPVLLFEPREVPLAGELVLREPIDSFKGGDKLQMVVVDTGENGLFTKGEFETITHLHQMEFITPEEIADQVVLELRGSNTGRDVIAAIDGSVMSPTYRAGYLRHFAIQELERLESQTGKHSVALGQLGPPELGKLLWEAYLLRRCYRNLSTVLEADRTAESLANDVSTLISTDTELARTITSLGLPILLLNGMTLLRGPSLRIPEIPGANKINCDSESVNTWATKGWVDLRPTNMELWKHRFEQMQREAHAVWGRGSAAVTSRAYLTDDIAIGSVVGWIFNNEMGGYRMK